MRLDIEFADLTSDRVLAYLAKQFYSMISHRTTQKRRKKTEPIFSSCIHFRIMHTAHKSGIYGFAIERLQKLRSKRKRLYKWQLPLFWVIDQSCLDFSFFDFVNNIQWIWCSWSAFGVVTESVTTQWGGRSIDSIRTQTQGTLVWNHHLAQLTQAHTSKNTHEFDFLHF